MSENQGNRLDDAAAGDCDEGPPNFRGMENYLAVAARYLAATTLKMDSAYTAAHCGASPLLQRGRWRQVRAPGHLPFFLYLDENAMSGASAFVIPDDVQVEDVIDIELPNLSKVADEAENVARGLLAESAGTVPDQRRETALSIAANAASSRMRHEELANFFLDQIAGVMESWRSGEEVWAAFRESLGAACKMASDLRSACICDSDFVALTVVQFGACIAVVESLPEAQKILYSNQVLSLYSAEFVDRSSNSPFEKWEGVIDGVAGEVGHAFGSKLVDLGRQQISFGEEIAESAVGESADLDEFLWRLSAAVPYYSAADRLLNAALPGTREPQARRSIRAYLKIAEEKSVRIQTSLTLDVVHPVRAVEQIYRNVVYFLSERNEERARDYLDDQVNRQWAIPAYIADRLLGPSDQVVQFIGDLHRDRDPVGAFLRLASQERGFRWPDLRNFR